MNFFVKLLVISHWLLIHFLIINKSRAQVRSILLLGSIFGLLSIAQAIIFGMLLGKFTNLNYGLDGVTYNPFNQAFAHVAIYAFSEEIAKFLPLAIFLTLRSKFYTNRQILQYFIMVGIVFGAVEDMLYGLGLSPIILMRLLIGLFFHAGLTALPGYYLGKFLAHQKSIIMVLLALAMAGVLHTLYNLSLVMAERRPVLGITSFLVSMVCNSLIFWWFYLATKNDMSNIRTRF